MLLGHLMRTARGEDEDDHIGRMEDPQVPAVADLPVPGGEDQPAGLVGMPERLLLTVFHQVVVHRLEQGQQPLQAVGERPLRQAQALRAQVLQQPVSGAVEEELVEQDRDPDRDPEEALGDHFGRWRRGDNARAPAPGAGGPIAPTPGDPPMGVDFDFQDGRVVGARERGEGPSAVFPTLRFGRQFDDLLDGGQMGISAAYGSRFPAWLAAWPRRPQRWPWSRPCARRVAAGGGGVGPGAGRSPGGVGPRVRRRGRAWPCRKRPAARARTPGPAGGRLGTALGGWGEPNRSGPHRAGPGEGPERHQARKSGAAPQACRPLWDFLSEGGQARTVSALDAETVGGAETPLWQRLASTSWADLAAQSVRAVHQSWHRQ